MGYNCLEGFDSNGYFDALARMYKASAEEAWGAGTGTISTSHYVQAMVDFCKAVRQKAEGNDDVLFPCPF
eukprot:598970-Pelagomonas_calceolata.AAC.13